MEEYEDFVTEQEAHMRLALELILQAVYQKRSWRKRCQAVLDIAAEGLGGWEQAEMVLAASVWPTADKEEV